MAKGGNAGAFVVLTIIALGGLGLGGYTFVNETFLGGDDHSHDLIPHEHWSDLKLVAFWDDLDENLTNNAFHSSPSDFLIEYDDLVYLDTNFVDPINNTRFRLAPGLYKVNLNVVLQGCVANEVYWVHLLLNDTTHTYFERYATGTTLTVHESYYYITTSVFINCTSSENYYEINARSIGSGFLVATDPATPYFNQFSIEYVIQ